MRLHETVYKVSSKLSREKLQKKCENLTSIQKTNEALGLSTYTIGASNSSLKIREAWLPKLEIDSSYTPLARLPLWCIDVAACAPSCMMENLKWGVINEGDTLL